MPQVVQEQGKVGVVSTGFPLPELDNMFNWSFHPFGSNKKNTFQLTKQTEKTKHKS